MALDDFVNPEVGLAVAATALVTSPQARAVMRRGLVYGLAGIFRLGDSVSSAARGVAEGAQQAASSTGSVVQEASTEARGSARGRRSASGTEPTTGE